jgi:hypothetical protein
MVLYADRKNNYRSCRKITQNGRCYTPMPEFDHFTVLIAVESGSRFENIVLDRAGGGGGGGKKGG